MRSAPWQSTPLADLDNAFFLLLELKVLQQNIANGKRIRGIVVPRQRRTPVVSEACASAGSRVDELSKYHPTFREHLLVWQVFPGKAPRQRRTPSLYLWKRSSHTPSLSILIRMTVSALSAKPCVRVPTCGPHCKQCATSVVTRHSMFNTVRHRFIVY